MPRDSVFAEHGFLPVDTSCFPLFRRYELEDESMLEQRGSVILTAWSFPGDGMYKIIDGCLCTAWFYQGQDIYFIVHEGTSGGFAKAVCEMYELSRAAGLDALNIHYAGEEAARRYEKLPGWNVVISTEDHSGEYVYTTENVLRLDGNVNRHKRYALNKYSGDSGLHIEPMKKDNLGVCMAVETEWCKDHDCDYCSSFFGCEKKALERMLELFDESLHQGFYVYRGAAPLGYLLCERKRDMVYLHYGKGNASELFPWLIYTVIERHFKDCAFVNYAEDMGHPGLRTAKQELGEYTLLHNYCCVFRRQS